MSSLRTSFVSFGFLLLTGCATSGTAVPVPESFTFELPDTSGKTVRLQDFAGKVCLVDVWATWCDPCAVSMPVYADLQRRYGPEGFAVIAVSVDEDADAVKRYVERKDLPFVVLRDPEGTVPKTLDAPAMPTAALIDREGRVLHVHAGFVPSDAEDIEARIREALGLKEQAPAAAEAAGPATEEPEASP